MLVRRYIARDAQALRLKIITKEYASILTSASIATISTIYNILNVGKTENRPREP